MHCLLLAAVIASIAVGDRAQAENEALSFQSSTYSSFRQLLTGAAPDRRVDVHAALGFPAASSGRVPAVILVHTLAGYRDQNEGRQASALREAGFATLTYDSFAGRGMGDLVATPRREPPPYASALADAFSALSALARDSRVDPQRIAILGFSFGGEVAHATAFERPRGKLAEDELRFAAHVAYYSAGVYGTVAAEHGYTGAPVLVMVGDDDTLPVAKAETYLAYARAAGYPAPIEFVTYTGAKHGWDRSRTRRASRMSVPGQHPQMSIRVGDAQRRTRASRRPSGTPI
jgi:dienelactone hydrolase